MKDRHAVFDLFLVSALGLFVELVFIRWAASELRMLAFYKNFALIAAFLGLGLGFVLKKYAALKNEKDTRSFLLTNAINNYGYLPIPLILALYDRETLGVLFMHNIGVEVAIWSVGILIISGQASITTSLRTHQ